MQALIDAFRHLQSHLLWKYHELFERAAHGQRPSAMIILGSDSRGLPERIMQVEPDDLFVLRNADNAVPPPDIARGRTVAVEYAVRELGVTDLIVCGHYRCGPVRTMHNLDDLGDLPHIREWQGAELWDRAVERKVLLQLEHLAKHPVVEAGLANHTLRLHAWVTRSETSDLLAYDPHSREFGPLLEMSVVHPWTPEPKPLSSTQLDIQGTRAAVARSRPTAINPPRRATLLVIESNRRYRNALGEWLRRSNFGVWLASNRDEGLHFYRELWQSIDLVLSEVKRPVNDGEKTLDALREINPSVRCCFMTGNARTASVGSLKQWGDLGIYTKPFLLNVKFAEDLKRLAANDQWPYPVHLREPDSSTNAGCEVPWPPSLVRNNRPPARGLCDSSG